MTVLSIPAWRWDAANDVPDPDAVLALECTAGHGVSITHQRWHLLDQSRCPICGCLTDLVYARRYSGCPCGQAVGGLSVPDSARTAGSNISKV